jgi:hypothetical protein
MSISSEMSDWLAIILITMVTRVTVVTYVTIVTKVAWRLPSQLITNVDTRVDFHVKCPLSLSDINNK